MTNSYMIQQNEELQRAEKELELTRIAMLEKEKEHQRQITEQQNRFLNKEKELQNQKNNQSMIDKMTKDIKPQIDEANEISKQLA